jgi:DNA replicative helicase MCM subunit Mcm2 (Cdc46/Mcm family)
MEESSNNKKADFEKDRELFKKFFVEYTEGIEGTKPYYLKLRSIKDREAEGGVIELNLSHLSSFSEQCSELVERTEQNCKRYVEIASEAVDLVLADEEL